jgi:cell division protein ZapA
MSKSLDVTIMGRDFRVACPEGEEQALLDAVDYLDKKMNEIRETGRSSAERIAVMAVEYRPRALPTPPGGFDIGEFGRRMGPCRLRSSKPVRSACCLA